VHRIAQHLAVSLLAIAADGGPAASASPDREASVRDRLVAHGFENVAVRATPDETVVWYENRIYRYELTALGVAAALAADEAPGPRLTLVPSSLGLPVLSVSAPAEAWTGVVRGRVSADAFRAVLEIGPGPPLPTSAVAHSSRWKADVAVRPLFAFELGRPDDVFRSSFALAPEITLSPFPGSLLTGQLVIRLTNDLQPDAADVAPGRSTLSWAARVPGSVLFAASGGIFPDDRWGFAAEGSRLLFDGLLELVAGGDLSGRLEFTHDAVLYSSLEGWSLFGAATGRTPGVDLEVRGSVARFLEGDLGVRLDVARRFHETRVAFFGIKTEAATVGGVQLAVPLPVKRQLPPRRLRPATVPSFPIEYRDTLGDIGRQVNHFNDTEWVRKGLLPTFVRNNVGDLRRAAPWLEDE